jgi:hypothetical protein
MIIFNLQLNHRDGQYFVVVATISENVAVAPNSEIPPWHKIIAPHPVP